MWDTVGWIVSSEPRGSVLEKISDGPITPKEISDEEGIRMEYVSRALSELCEEDLAECLNPDAHKGRLYKITDDGEGVLSIMKENDL